MLPQFYISNIIDCIITIYVLLSTYNVVDVLSFGLIVIAISSVLSLYNGRYSEHDVIMTSLIIYPDLKSYFFDFLLIQTMTTRTTTIIIIINIIVVITARPIIKPVLEFPVVDDNAIKDLDT